MLPQGGVTSPALSNIICIRLDKRIACYVGKRNIVYTRYADDMAFSSLSPKRLVGITRVVTDILKDEGFTLNSNKTRFLGPRRQRKITGLIISDRSIGIGKKRKRKLRAEIHHFALGETKGIKAQILKNRIIGWLSFMNSVNPQGLKQIKKYIKQLSKKSTKENILNELKVVKDTRK